MQNGMTISDLLNEVQRQQHSKRDFIADTQKLMVRNFGIGLAPSNVRLVMGTEDHNGIGQLEDFSISEHCHRQISARLGIPWKYYQRLLRDHTDMVIDHINKLFEREPEMRMVRTLDGEARAFLSNSYKRIDNDQILSQVLPPIVKGDIQATPLNSNVDQKGMALKVLFTDDRLAIDLGEAPGGRMDNGWGGNVDLDAQHKIIARRDAGRDIVRPGAVITNNEVGGGTLRFQGFFYRSYCLNGCVWGTTDLFDFQRRHVGSKVITAGELWSSRTEELMDQTIISQIQDGFAALTSQETVQRMGDRLRAAKSTESLESPMAAVQELVGMGLQESEVEGTLMSLMRDQDFTQWGLVNAVTEQANSEEISYERASELENLGAEILNLNFRQWQQLVHAEAA